LIAPKSATCRTSDKIERLICTEKRLRSTWGPKKIRQVLMTKHGVEAEVFPCLDARFMVRISP
jgi:hypothetical protein